MIANPNPHPPKARPNPPVYVANLGLTDRGLDTARVWVVSKAAVPGFLETLPEADSEMLVISMNFYDFKTGKAHIPDDILAGLADSMGTTPESIKTKRGRLLRKLEEYLETKT